MKKNSEAEFSLATRTNVKQKQPQAKQVLFRRKNGLDIRICQSTGMKDIRPAFVCACTVSSQPSYYRDCEDEIGACIACLVFKNDPNP